MACKIRIHDVYIILVTVSLCTQFRPVYNIWVVAVSFITHIILVLVQ